jgi:N-acetylglucosaminyldiphosphoundecaprenol N-acetyl-beta-D-mannosaminyltransferase
VKPRTPSRAVAIGDLMLDNHTPAEADAIIESWAHQPDGRGRFVCTPNVDYVVRARRDPSFRGAVNAADLRVPDGMWIVYASRIAGRPLRATVTGRLLLPRLATTCRDHGLAIGIIGAGPGIAEAAARNLRASNPGLEVWHAISPPARFVVDSAADREIVREIAARPPSILFVALGAPKQEVWMQRHVADFPDSVLIGVGAGVDIVAGRFRVAPSWMTRVGLEWLFRLAQEPRRLAHRYLVDDPWILWWAIRTRLRGQRTTGE